MKDKRKVHKIRTVDYYLAECGMNTFLAGIPRRWDTRWSRVTCLRCLKHRPTKREASDGK